MAGTERRQRALVLLGASVPAVALAAPWQIDSGVSATATYTDNINLAPPGQERSDFVVDVTPRFSIRQGERVGRGRITLNLDYNLQTFTVGRNAVPNSLNHQLQADLNAEVVRQMVFLDARGTISQQNLTNTGSVSDNNVSNTGNRVDVMTFALSPYFRHHLGNYADTELRYTFDKVFNQAPAADSRSNGISAQINSGSRFSRLPWGLSYSRREIQNSDASDTTFETLDGRVDYRFNRRFSSFVSAGVDSNDFATSQAENDGTRWRVGGTWTPSDRTRFEAGYGERFFGSSFNFDLSHRSRRTVWTARYAEDTTTTRDIQLAQELVQRTDPFGQPIDNTDLLNAFRSATTNPTLTTEVLVNKRLEGTAAWRGRRSTATARLFHDRREFQVSGNSERVVGGGVDFSRRLSRDTDGLLFGNWSRTDVAGGGREDTRWDMGLSLTRQLATDVSGSLEYRHVEQDSDLAQSEYRENRYSARLSVAF